MQFESDNALLQDSLTDGTRTRWVSTVMYIGMAVAVVLKDTRMV